MAAGCTGGQPPTDAEQTVAVLDSVFSELGGIPTAAMTRSQRWRMISSIGAGLPLTSFQRENLPEPNTRGPALLQAYCVQCHWLPDPQMHTAAEWPILVRRMLMRASTLQARLGGPVTEGLLGEILVAGMGTAALPQPSDADSLIAYLQRNAMPAARPDEYTGEGSELVVQKCSLCHELPSTTAHTAAGWEDLVRRMQANMGAMDVPPLASEEADAIIDYLKSRAANQ
jgi:mono/diheme cytochrome c family protein